MKYYKYEVSGEYRAKNGEVEDFDTIDVIIPESAIPQLNHFLYARILPLHLMELKDKPKYASVYQFFVNTDAKEVKVLPEYVKIDGKDITKMNEKEIQYLAIHYGLMGINAPKTCTISTLRENALREYFKKVVKFKNVDKMEYSDLCNQKDKVVKLPKTMVNYNNNLDVRKLNLLLSEYPEVDWYSMDIADLREIADRKKVLWTEKTTMEELIDLLYPISVNNQSIVVDTGLAV